MSTLGPTQLRPSRRIRPPRLTYNGPRYTLCVVIRTFADRDTEKLHLRERIRRFQAIEDVARKRLLMLDAAVSLDDLAAVPGNRLEKMPEFGSDVYSVRVNQQYRILFRWVAGHAEEVRLTDHYKS